MPFYCEECLYLKRTPAEDGWECNRPENLLIEENPDTWYQRGERYITRIEKPQIINRLNECSYSTAGGFVPRIPGGEQPPAQYPLGENEQQWENFMNAIFASIQSFQLIISPSTINATIGSQSSFYTVQENKALYINSIIIEIFETLNGNPISNPPTFSIGTTQGGSEIIPSATLTIINQGDREIFENIQTASTLRAGQKLYLNIINPSSDTTCKLLPVVNGIVIDISNY